MFSLIGAILAIGLLIVVHEAGHFFVARWCKMRVDRFSLGFGPAIVSWKRGETDFTIGPIPFGGFVLINGMMSADEVDADDPRQYPNRPVWQRFLTIFAGPATNYLTAIVFAIVLFTVAGVQTGTSWLVIDHFVDDVEAVGGLRTGDKIIKVEDNLFYNSYGKAEQPSLLSLVQKSQGSEMTFTVVRDGEEMVVKATPKLVPGREYWFLKLVVEIDPSLSEYIVTQADPRFLLGIDGFAVEAERSDVGFISAVGHAFMYPVRQTKLIGKGLYEIVTGAQDAQVSSVVGITAIAKKSFEAGWIAVFTFMMVLNVYLGLFNLLPLPALDGGRLVFLAYEMATRRRANPKVEATVHMVGIMALLLLMVVVTYKDIARLF